MKFVRHLAAVTLVVAAVVVLGLIWNHFGASTLAPNVSGRFSKEIVDSQHPGTVVLRGPGGGPGKIIQIRNQGGMDLGLTSMLQAVNRPVVEHTIGIEAAVIAAVVVLDLGRRRARRTRRAAALGPYRPPGQPARRQPVRGQPAGRQPARRQPAREKVTPRQEAASRPAGRAASQEQQEPDRAP